MSTADSTMSPPFKRLVVVLDPSSPGGETGVELAQSLMGGNGHIHLVVALASPEAWALGEFAAPEEVSVSEAAWTYIDQVVERLGHDRLSATVIEGYDLAADLMRTVAEQSADAIVVTALMGARAMATKRSWATLPFPVLVVPRSPVAA